MRRMYRILLVACLLLGAADSLFAQYLGPPFRRKDLANVAQFPAADQKELRDLMMAWIDAGVISQHLTAGIHCNNEFFFTWHREYIAQLEAWLMTQDYGTKYVPLPKWIPSGSPIPNAFFNNLVAPGAVETGYTPLGTQNITGNPGTNFTAFVDPGICTTYTAGSQWRACTGFSFGTAADNYAQAVEGPHGTPHVAVGGAMGAVFSAPAAAIFFAYHAHIDDIYRYYQCQCQGATAKDLYMKDDPKDVGTEPNTTSPGGVIWESPDIWVRQSADPYIVSTGKYTNEDRINREQNAEYSALGNPNYVYVRIRNNGCQTVNAGEVHLRVYWTKASTGVFGWPIDWTTLPQGSEITVGPGIPVPALQPGQQYVAEVPWVVPDPSLYPTDPGHFCLLARLESGVDPMAVIEGTDVGTNTVNNNNVAWKNIVIEDTNPFNIVGPGDDDFDVFFVGLVNHNAERAGIRFNFPENPGLNITVDLGQELYAAWERGGLEGHGFEQVGEFRLKIIEPGATIDRLELNADELYRPSIQAYVENNPEGGKPYMNFGDRLEISIEQYELNEDGVEATVGGIVYKLRAVEKADGVVLIEGVEIGSSSCPEEADGEIHLSMVGGADEYTYWWSNGANGPDVDGLSAGEYRVTVRDQDGNIETRAITVESASTLQLEMEATLSHCGNPDGSASVAVSGGGGKYSYKWYRDGQPLTGQNGPTVVNAVPGDYSVEVSDGGGCAVTGSVQVRDEWNMLEVFVGTVDASAPNKPDGEAEVHALGMPPYTYRWSNGATTSRVTGLLPGPYWVEVKDMAGCVVRRDFVIGVKPANLQGVDRGNTVVANTSIVPNPTANDAELRYRLQRPDIVRVELYDNLGRRVDLLFSGYLSVGDHSLRIETAGLANGQYTVRILSADIVTSVPLVVVR